MTYLLDVNVLIALLDTAHIGHEASHRWFSVAGAASWATCPLTENGLIRIIGNPRYPNSAGSPAEAAAMLIELRSQSGHQFWPDDLSLAGNDLIDVTRVTTPAQVTDTYLLGLAVAHDAQLATLDRRLSTTAVRRGSKALYLIDTYHH